jgi:hypothetical protein
VADEGTLQVRFQDLPGLSLKAPFPDCHVVSAGISWDAGTGKGSGMWLWILVGVVVIIGVVVVLLVLRYMGVRDSVVTGGWIAEAIDAYTKGMALHEAISTAVRPEALAASDSGTRWADIRRRADGLAQELQMLRHTAADPEDRATATDALGSLQALQSALDDLSNAPGDAERVAAIRDRVTVFEKSLRAMRAPNPHLW